MVLCTYLKPLGHTNLKESFFSPVDLAMAPMRMGGTAMMMHPKAAM